MSDGNTPQSKPSLFSHIATELYDPESILQEIAGQQPVRPEPETAFVAPRTETEARVARVWAELLNLERVGVHDDFFALGGHSLLAVQLASRLRDACGVPLPLSSLSQAPTVAGLAAEIERLRGAGEVAEAGEGLPQLVPQPEAWHAPFPLTEVQQAYWIGRSADFELGNVATHAYLEFESVGLDLARLEEALGRLIERHGMLRAVVGLDGQQRVLAEVPPYRIEVLDLRGWSVEAAEEELAALRERMSHQVLPSERWPLFEIRATRLAGERVRLHLSVDLLIADARSWQIFSQELALVYQDQRAELPPLELTFRDYVLAEAGLRESELYQRALAYWREQLVTLPPAPELPLAQSPEGLAQPRFVRREGRLEAEAWARLKARAQGAGLTPSGVLLAAFAEVLTAWSKRPHFTINLTLFNRSLLHPQVNEVVGDFTSLTLLEVDQRGTGSFEARARRLQERLWADLDHRHVSGVRVLRELAHLVGQGRGSGALMPVVFTSILNVDPAGGGGLDLAYLGELVYGVTQTPQVWLDHQVGEQGGALVFNWDAVEALFPAGLLDDAFDAYCRLLERLAEDEAAWGEPSWRLLPLPEAQLAGRAAANATATPLSEELLHTLFAAQAAQRPGDVAVVTPERTLNYGELARRSNQVGHWLRERGARPNTLVAVVMNKGWEQVVAALGVLAAGAAYLPIDPELPAQRVTYLLEHGQVALALTQPHLGERLAWPEGVLRLSVAEETLAGLEATPLAPVQGADDLAYVIFTSGSTGLPKGVMIEHRGAVNTILDVNRRFNVTPHDRVFALSRLNFDLSVYDLFGPLAAGGALVLPSAEGQRDPGHWLALLERERVTVWDSVPALLEMLVTYLEGLGERLPEALRLVFLSGDWIPLTLPERVWALGEGVAVWSGGGATEASIWSITYPVEQVEPGWSSIPYGRPLTNQRFHVLDESLSPRPVWVPGELYIGGAGLARGYWRDPARTAASFVPTPSGEGTAPASRSVAERTEGGERLYRTGDLGRYLPDGSIEFLGREDFQVKVRGHRIELGEIEAALTQHPGVRTGVVTALGDPRGDKRLVAYLVPEGAPGPASDELRSFLSAKLPGYMVPTAFVTLDALPLTPNGKVDRRALPVPDAPGEAAPGFEAPRTPTEAVLAEIWAQVLGVEPVGVHDDLFELGGDSLQAIHIILHTSQAFDVELPIRNLFVTPTVAGLAAEIERLRGAGETAEVGVVLPQLTPEPEAWHAPFPLTEVQQAYWIGRSADFELGNVATHAYLEFESVGLDLARLEEALGQLIERHGMLRAVVELDGQQRVLAEVPPYRIEVLDLRGWSVEAAEEELAALRERMSHQVLPSERWPLFEIRATRLAGERVRLHLSVDLLIGDAWSMRLLRRELRHLYQDPRAELPPLELTFRDYVLAEAGLRESELYQRALAYWRERLVTLPPAPELPLAQSSEGLAQPRFVRREGRLEAEAWGRLKAQAQGAGLTPSGVLLAVFAEVLAAWSKRPHFTINLTLFNRLPLHPQVNEVVGDFTSLTLLEVDLRRAGSFEARARRLQERLWADLDHRYVGGVHVLRELARRQGGAPRALMPVVFTSTLVQTAPGPKVTALAEGDAGASAFGERVYGVTQTPQVWLDHQVGEQAGALIFKWDAVEALFPAGLLDDVSDAYCRLLERLAEGEVAWGEPSWRLLPLPEVQLAGRAAANATAAPLSEELLHTLFAAQAAQRPGDVAVVTLERTLTYGELVRLSNQVGHWLRERGARPNTLVAVVMDKGWEQVVGVLGVLAAGAAYLPIDPELPAQRVTYLLEHGQVALALTQPHLERLAWPEGVLRLVVAEGTLAGLEATPLAPVQGADDLAYVIFTSGSTGLPKGVMIEHRGAVNTILDVNRRFNVTPQDRVFALSRLNFDLSVYDLFGPLAAGGALVLPSAGGKRDPGHWLALLERERVTVWDSVPALLEMLVTYLEGRGERLPEALRLVFLSGDWIPLTLPERVWALGEDVAVWSGGGATEASIWSIAYPVEQVEPGWSSIPYGWPLVNQRFHVLDAGLAPRPVWVPGELYIEGVGLARGYWRDPARTAASFVPAPSEEAGERLYRTGDLGRYLPDGGIEFLGREDFQVKVRGHRIELGEIEAALTQHPGVRTGVVTALGDPRGDKRLVAYLVPEQELASADDGRESPLPQDYHPSQDQTVILDPVERLKFKLAHPALRRDAEERPHVPLAEIEPDVATYVARRSYRTFAPQTVPFEHFSRLLNCLQPVELEEVPLPKYRYASAGSLYPVQVYLYVKPERVQGLAGGTYYYHPPTHRLVLLSDEVRLHRGAHALGNRAIFDASAFSIFLVGQLDAITPLYGQWARDFCMLEAGLMAQLLETAAPACQIGLCQIGGFDFAPLRPWFALDEGHVYLHSLLGGRIEPAQARLPALVQGGQELRTLLDLIGESEKGQEEKKDGVPAAAVRPDAAFIDQVRGFLETKLPGYMVPTTFVLLDALPLTPNGKVDRRALPAPDVSQPARAAGFVAPETEVEQAIAAVWCEVLGVEKLGVHDNFFDLGGNSVHVVQVHGKLRERLGGDIPIVKLFEYPTVHTLALYVGQGQETRPALAQSGERAEARRASRHRRRQARGRQAGLDPES